MSDTASRANVIANAICGSCDALEDHTTDAERGDIPLMNELDSLVFCCDQCGWWCEISEQADREDDQICNDCNHE